MSNKRKHKSLTLKDKMAVLNMLDNGEPMADIAQRFGIGRTTIYDIKLRRSVIMAHVNISDKRKTLKTGKYPECDTAVYNWFLEERAKNTPISGDIMRQKCKEIYLNLTGEEFKASSGWLVKFNKRFGIKFNASGLAGDKPSYKSHDENVVTNFLKSFKEKVEELGLVPDQLYCTDASGLMWRVMTKEKEESLQRNLNRITFMPCSNSTGTHKLDLLVITKEPIESFKNTLPICYKNQTNGWVTREVFTDWFHEEFVPAVRKFMNTNNLSEKALLVLDEAPGYPEEYFLNSNDGMVQVMFLPAEYSHMIQPMDQTLMEIIKIHYKKKLILDVVSKGGDVKMNLKNLNLIDALSSLADTWNSLPTNIIGSSWKKLYPNIDLSADYEEPTSIDHLLVAFQESGIHEKVQHWLEGKIEVIIEESVGTLIKSEDPLAIQESPDEEGRGFIATVPNVSSFEYEVDLK